MRRIRKITTLLLTTCLCAGAVRAEGVRPVRIGVLNDATTGGAEQSGVGSIEAARMAIAQFGPMVLGRPIELHRA